MLIGPQREWNFPINTRTTEGRSMDGLRFIVKTISTGRPFTSQYTYNARPYGRDIYIVFFSYVH